MRRLALWFFVLSITPALVAQPQNSRVTIDGKLNEPFWQHIQPEPFAPAEAGVPAKRGGEIRAAIVGRYLYLGATLPEPGGRLVAQSIGRNPVWEGGEGARSITMPRRYTYGSPDGEDFVRFIIRVYNENDWMVQVGPLGGYSIKWRWTGEHEWYTSVPYKCDGFLVAASVENDRWTAEAAIPLEQIGSPRPGYVQLRAERNRADRPDSPQEWWSWPTSDVTSVVPELPSAANFADPIYRPPLIGNTDPPIEIGHVSSAPPLQSQWTDPVWKNVPAWTLRRNEPAERLPQFPTQVKLVQDGSTLAILARCIEPGRIIAKAKERDGHVTAGDHFSVYLATTGSSYVVYAINPEGYIYDAAGHQGSPRLANPYVSWNSPVRGAAWKQNGEWLARLDLPLAAISQTLGEVRIPRDWRILLMRSRPGRDGEPQETSELPVTQSLRPYGPSRYRRIQLADTSPSQLPRPAIAERTGNLAFLPSRVLSAEQRKQMNLSDMLENYTKNRGKEIVAAEGEAWNKVQTRAEWENFRDSRIKALKASLEPFPARAPLDVRVTSEFRGDGYRRQNLVYQSQPGIWVTANLYLPAEPREQMPAIILIHSLHGPKTQFELQDMGIMWAREGCAVLATDQIGYGELIQTYPWDRASYHSRYTMGEQLYLIGSSLMTWMYWDIDRGVDLLWQRPDVDKKEIMIFGGVAGGGDPAAVVTALDPRVSVSVPFNFGQVDPIRANEFGDWASIRSLRLSISDQFLPWLICASVAPRYFIFSHELTWDVEKIPAWARYQKVWGFYNALDHLAEAHGFGPFPGPGEAWSIGPGQRRSLEPTLARWFGIPIPWEDQESTKYENLAKRPIEDRRPVSDLVALTPAVAAELHPKTLSEVAMAQGEAQVKAAREKLTAMPPSQQQDWLRAEWKKQMGGNIEPNPHPEAAVEWTKEMPLANVEAITLSTEPGITVPMLLMLPNSHAKAAPAVVAVSEGGKDLFLDKRSDQIEALLRSGYAVCLPDVRGTGETTADWRRDPDSAEILLGAGDYMMGDSLLGQRLKDLRTVLVYLRGRRELDARRIGLWGDSFAPPNPERILMDELPQYEIGPQIKQNAEPLGEMLAMLGALYEPDVKTIAVHGGLSSFLSMLQDGFPYVPQDVMVPNILEMGDIGAVAAALAPRPVELEGTVNGKDQLVSEGVVRSEIAPNGALAPSVSIRASEGGSDFAGWFRAHL